MNWTRDAIALALSLLAVFAAAAIGGLGTSAGLGSWYDGLAKPPWNPPSWVFGPVWTVLYLMMAVAAWLLWRSRRTGHTVAVPLGLYGVQLALNAAWPLLFFGLREPGWAMLELAALWVVLLATVVAFWRRSVAAAVLLLPYLAWVSYAASLNWAIWRLNSAA